MRAYMRRAWRKRKLRQIGGETTGNTKDGKAEKPRYRQGQGIVEAAEVKGGEKAEKLGTTTSSKHLKDARQRYLRSYLRYVLDGEMAIADARERDAIPPILTKTAWSQPGANLNDVRTKRTQPRLDRSRIATSKEPNDFSDGDCRWKVPHGTFQQAADKIPSESSCLSGTSRL